MLLIICLLHAGSLVNAFYMEISRRVFLVPGPLFTKRTDKISWSLEAKRLDVLIIVSL